MNREGIRSVSGNGNVVRLILNQGLVDNKWELENKGKFAIVVTPKSAERYLGDSALPSQYHAEAIAEHEQANRTAPKNKQKTIHEVAREKFKSFKKEVSYFDTYAEAMEAYKELANSKCGKKVTPSVWSPAGVIHGGDD